MKCLDILSEPPNMLIFQNEKNKKTSGAVFSIILFIIMIIISVAYIHDYAINDKYTFEAMKFYNFTNDDEELQKIVDNDKYKPYLNFDVRLRNDNFTVCEGKDCVFLEKNYTDIVGDSRYIFSRLSNAYLINIIYKCGADINCSSFYELVKSGNIYYGQIDLTFPRYKINHAADIPVTRDNEEKKKIHRISVGFSRDLEFYISRFEWEVMIYQDQKSFLDLLFNNNKEYIFGHFKNDGPEKEKKYFNLNKHTIINKGDNYFLVVSQSTFSYNFYEYLLYKRKRISFFDVIGKILAYLPTLKSFFSIIFSLYSNKIDNYEILEKILNPAKDINKKIELEKFNISEIIPDDGKNKDKEKQTGQKKTEPLIDKSSSNNISEKPDNNRIDEVPQIALDKFSCFSFLFNNIYSKCCGTNKNQEKINKINDIVCKYISIESLIYNQIKIENLFKDYKWNNKILNNIQSNTMINQLKNT
jgi:hypothetical protein